MERRRFLQLGGAAAVIGAVGFRGNAFGESRSGSKPLTVADFRGIRRHAKLPQGRIAYVDLGKGETALFLHGFPLNSFQWRDIMASVAQHRRCVAADFLGLGYTEVAAGQSVAPKAQVEMLAALLDSLKIGQVDLVANDSGGAVAQLFTVRYPERVRSLLLTNCDTEPDSPPPAVVPVIESARKGQFPDEFLLPSYKDKAFARSAKGLGGATFTYPDRLADETIDYYLGPLVSSPGRKELANAYAIGLDPNPLAGVEKSLKACKVPVRIVWGTGDKIFSQQSPDYLDRTFGNSRGVRRVQGANLFFPEEFPDVIVEEALRLWVFENQPM